MNQSQIVKEESGKYLMKNSNSLKLRDSNFGLLNKQLQPHLSD